MLIQKSPDTREKLEILSQDSKYDLACACTPKNGERRIRSTEDKWIYPTVLPQTGQTFLFKTLISNVCKNNCGYCPLRAAKDPRRCTLEPEETARVFLEYYRTSRVIGLFLSSGVTGSADKTMERINATASILRKKYRFRGYIHLKIIPGASPAAVEEAVSLANTVSLNIEVPGEQHFRNVCPDKNYMRDIIEPVKQVNRLTAKDGPYRRVNQTTQFIVGASNETDKDIVHYSWGLYKKLGLERIYFSAYQRGTGEADLPGENSTTSNSDILTREHRLYQTDFLIRKYGFHEKDIGFTESGNLSLEADPKEMWAKNHPEVFPLDINHADKYELLRVPGLGPITVNRILKIRKNGGRVFSMENIGKPGKRLNKAKEYLKIN